MSEDICIEADGDFESGPIDVDDEDLNAAFEAESNAFMVIDEVHEKTDKEKTVSKEKDVEKKKFIIPKLKRPKKDEYQDMSHIIGEEEKRDWQKGEKDIRARDRDAVKKDHRSKEKDVKERDNKNREQDDKRNSKESRGEKGRNQSGSKLEVAGPAVKSSAGTTIPSVKCIADKRTTLFESFAKEGLIAKETCTVTSAESKTDQKGEKTGKQINVKKESEIAANKDSTMEIPLGRDSLASLRGYHVWQVLLYPVNKMDVARADFAQVWAMADSSSVVWSGHNDFGGVAEFLLKDQSSIQKFMRKLLWHNFSSEILTVEIIEREQEDDSESLDTVANKMIFKYNNKRARQLIKTYYPTPKGEITERSVYVNNINSGKAVSLLKAVFPCAANISVARSATEASTAAVVETAGADEAVNYLVVYLQMSINDADVLLSSLNSDWEDARKKFEERDASEANKTVASSKPAAETTFSKSASSICASKYPAVSTSPSSSGINISSSGKNRAVMKGKGHGTTTKPYIRRDDSARGQGGYSLGGRGRRGGSTTVLSRNAGRTLLPDPPQGGGLGGLGDGLLPLPTPSSSAEVMMRGVAGPEGLLPLPIRPLGSLAPPTGIRDDQLELTEIRQELEARAQLDLTQRRGLLSVKPRRTVDYLEEEERSRDVPRRTLLPFEGGLSHKTERDEWMDEEDFRRRPHLSQGLMNIRPPLSPLPGPPPISMDRSYDVGASYSGVPFIRSRNEDYGDERSTRSRPYLLEAPPESSGICHEPEEKQVYDYEHADRHNHMEPEARRDDTRALLGRPSLMEREISRPPLLDRDRSPLRRDYLEDQRVYGSLENRYVYDDVEPRQPLLPSYALYNEDSSRRQADVRYKDDFDHLF